MNIDDELELFDESENLIDEDLDDFEEESDHPELLVGEYDDEELERRRIAYASLKKKDKIYNNTYNLGYDYSEEDEDSSNLRQTAHDLKLDSGSADYHLQDVNRYSEHVDQVIMQKEIYNFICSNIEVQAILGNEPEKKKFTKSEINKIFQITLKGLSVGSSSTHFVSPIHIMDVISGTINMEYKKLFDNMSYEHKELLLVELDKSYDFLKGKPHKIF